MNILRTQIGFNDLRVVLNGLRWPLSDDLAKDQDLDTVAEFHDKLHPMLNKEDSHPEFPVNLSDDLDHSDQLVRGHTRSGFIKKEDFGIGGHSTGHFHPALGPVGQAVHDLVSKLTDVKGLHEPVAMLLDLLLLPSAGRGTEEGPEQAVAELGIMGEPDMIQHIQMPPKEQILEGPADAH